MAKKGPVNKRANIWLNISGDTRSLKTLRGEAGKLRNEISKLTPGTQKFIQKTKQLDVVNKRMKKINSSMRQQKGLWSRLADGANKYFTLFASISAGLAGLVIGFQKINSTISDFERTLTNVYTLLSDEDLQKYGKFIEEGSVETIRKYGFAIEDTNKALFDAISAGVEAENSIKHLDEAARLAVGGVTDLAVANDGLTSILNAYHLEMEETANVSDAFFSAQKAGKTTVAELASGIGKVAPLTDKLDISYQELLASTAALTKGGIGTEEAFTYLRGTMVNLMKPSDDLTKLFVNEFGHGLGVTEVRARGFNTIMEEMNVLMEKFPDELSEAVPNVRALTATMALSGEGLEEYQKILKQVNTDVGKNSSLNKAFAMQQETIAFKLNQARGELKGTALDLKEALIPVMKKMFSLMSKFNHLMVKTLTFIKEHSTSIKALWKVLKSLIIGITAYKTVLFVVNNYQKVSNALQIAGRKIVLLSSIAYNKLTGNIARAAAAQRVLNVTMKSNPIGLIVGLLATAAAAFFTFRNKVKDATDEQKAFNAALQESQDIITNTKSLEDRYKQINRLTKTQLENLKTEAQSELENLDDLEIKMISHFKKKIDTDEKYAKLQEGFRNATNGTIKSSYLYDIRAIESKYEKETEAMYGMTYTTLQESHARIEIYKNEAEEKLKAFAPEELPKGSGSVMSDAEKKKLAKKLEEEAKIRQEAYESWAAEDWYINQVGEEAWADYLNNRKNATEDYYAYQVRLAEEATEASIQATKEWLDEDMLIMQIGEDAYEQYIINRKSEDESYFEWLKRKREEDGQNERDFWNQKLIDAAGINSAITGMANSAKDLELSKLREVNQMKGESDEAYQVRVAALEKKKKDIAIKYADVEFATSAGRIIIDTAAAIMKALAQLGPIAGGIAAGAIGITGGLQLAAANQQRQAIKGLYWGGYSGDGDPTQEAGLLPNGQPYHKQEYVIPHFIRNNPVIAEMEPIIENIRRQKIGGYYEGGENTDKPQGQSVDSNAILIAEIKGLRKDLKNLTVKGIAYYGQDEVIKIREEISKQESVENTALK